MLLSEGSTTPLEDAVSRIPFVEKEEPASNVRPLKRTEESNRAAQKAAKDYLEHQKSAPPPPPQAPPKLFPPAQALPKRKLYRVVESPTIPRGASSFRLPLGKVIDNVNYDIEKLRLAGVGLVPYEPTDHGR
jgi:hypothetical protein